VTLGAARPPERQAVDSTLALFRVDRCDEARVSCRPLGGFAVFAIHGTGLPAANDLFDADLHGVVARTVEDHLREAGGADGFLLLAQGAQGDVAPNLPDPELCRLYRFIPERAPRGPGTLPRAEAWRAPDAAVEACLERARRSADSLAARLGARISTAFDAAADDLSSDVRLRRAFRTVELPAYAGPSPICWPPRMGAAALGGTEQGYIRTWRHRVLFFDLDFHEGAARSDPEGCFGYKKTRLGFIVEEYSLPRVLQIGVLSVGSVLLATVPVEPTTETGALLRERLLERRSADAARALVVALTNGYALYVASEAEYAAQHYEGGATIYGPGSAEMIAHEVGELAATLAAGTPEVDVGPVSAFSRSPQSHFWPARPVPDGLRRESVSARCANDGLSWRWTDLRPGTLLPADGLVAEVQRMTGGAWEPAADDGSPEIRVRALGERGAGYLWEVDWRPVDLPLGTYRLRVPQRAGLPELMGEACTVP
jgi:neutral ceramidase